METEFSSFGSDSLTINPLTFALISMVTRECGCGRERTRLGANVHETTLTAFGVGLGDVQLGNGYRRTMLTQSILRENRKVRSAQYAATVIVLSAICIGVALLMPTGAPGGDAARGEAGAIGARE